MRRQLLILLIMCGVLSLLPIALHSNTPVMHLLIMCLIWAVAASAWDLIMGYAGVFTFAQVAFLVIGAYSSAILSNRLGISPWLGMPAGGAIACLSGILIALPCLRLKAAYVALLTFAFHMMLTPLLRSDLGRMIGTGGTKGILSIPPLAVGGHILTSFDVVPWYYLALGLFFACHFAIYRIIYSSWGLGFVALRDSEDFAKGLGIDDFRYKLTVYGISAFLTGMIGGFYAHYTGVLSTRILGLDLFLLLMVMQVVGGMGLFPGTALGSFIITFSNENLRVAGVYRLVVFGAIVVLLVFFRPRGIMGAILPARGLAALDRFGYVVQRTFKRQLVKKGMGRILRRDLDDDSSG